ncbi:hypothetical protein [Snodgrassella communis]|uniref:Uncharacterized protein n=1 Tax=Snodgrassella alvi TaxID=1196083 RepID=A0A2N9XWU2_9NEIS|nr:hypothetical protein [Snodgrassella communis]PIT54247.1 hypothetical protein BHC48_00760 [Snodgrassella communis]
MSSTIHLKEQPISCLEVYEMYLSFFEEKWVEESHFREREQKQSINLVMPYIIWTFIVVCYLASKPAVWLLGGFMVIAIYCVLYTSIFIGIEKNYKYKKEYPIEEFKNDFATLIKIINNQNKFISDNQKSDIKNIADILYLENDSTPIQMDFVKILKEKIKKEILKEI